MAPSRNGTREWRLSHGAAPRQQTLTPLIGTGDWATGGNHSRHGRRSGPENSPDGSPPLIRKGRYRSRMPEAEPSHAEMHEDFIQHVEEGSSKMKFLSLASIVVAALLVISFVARLALPLSGTTGATVSLTDPTLIAMEALVLVLVLAWLCVSVGNLRFTTNLTRQIAVARAAEAEIGKKLADWSDESPGRGATGQTPRPEKNPDSGFLLGSGFEPLGLPLPRDHLYSHHGLCHGISDRTNLPHLSFADGHCHARSLPSSP